MNKRIAKIIVIIAPFLLFMPEILSGKSIFWGLPILQFYPWRELAFSQIMNGDLPLWNLYNGLGTPLVANYQSALMYPFTWLIFIYYWVGQFQGLVWGHLIINILHLSIADFGIVKICEEKGYSTQAAIISAISYSLSGYLLARFGFFSMIWPAAWLPWIFLYSLKVLKARKLSSETIKLAIVISLLLLSGHAQLSWYILIFSGIYFLFQYKRPMRAWINQFSQFFIASIVAVGISAIQLLPTAELLLHSQRSSAVEASTSMTYSFWPWHFLNFLNPNLFGHPIRGDYWGYGAYWEDAVYIGLLPILLCLTIVILLLRKRKINSWHNSEIAFFAVMSLISILFSLGSNTPIFPWLYKNIPSFDMFNAPARYMIWFVFSSSLLAGAAFDQWKKPEKKTLYWVRLGTAGGFAIGLGALLMLIGGDSIKATFIRATFEISVAMTLIGVLYLLNPITDSLHNNKPAQIWKWAVVFFVLFDLFYMNLNHTPVQAISTVDDYVNSIDGTVDTFYVPEAVDYDYRYNATLNFDNFSDSVSSTQLASSNLANVNILARKLSLNNFEPMRFASYDRFISELNKLPTDEQKKILAAYSINKYGTLNKSDSSIIEYEDIQAADKILGFSTALENSSMESMLSKVVDTPCVYLIDETLEEAGTPMEKCMPIDADVSNLQWHGNIISFDLNTSSDAWVLIANAYDAGWHLKVDNLQSDVYQANGFITAFEVTKGEHSILLTYLPRSIIIGSLISLASLILMCILIYRLKKTQH